MGFHVDRFWRYAVDEINPIEGHPDILCDGFMMDLAQPRLDLQKTGTPKPYEKVLILIIMASACDERLTFHRRGWDRNPVSNDAGACAELQSEFSCSRLQWRYYRYFQLAYPGCRFYGNGNAHVIAVRQNGLVGMVMPLNPLNEWLERKPSEDK